MPSEYERQREANIAKNKALLAELNLLDPNENLGITPKQKSKAKPVQPKAGSQKRKASDEPAAPRRQSSRLKSTLPDPNETREEREKREAEAEARRKQEEEDRLLSEERDRLAKRPRHEELDLDILSADTPDEDRASLRRVLSDACRARYPRAVGDDKEAWEDETAEDREVKALKEQAKKLRIVSRAKVTQDRVYSMAYHPDKTKDLIFVGDKHGQLGIWDATAENGNDEDEEGGKYWRLQVHWPASSKSSLSCIKLDPIDAHSLYTTSYDCTIRHLSFTSGISREIFSLEDSLISSIDLPPQGNEMWISDSLGGLSHMDLREDKRKAKRYELQSKKIGSVSVNPVHNFAILTACNDKYLRLWDARKLSQAPLGSSLTPPSSPAQIIAAGPREISAEEIEAFRNSASGQGMLKGEWEHKMSVSSAFWDPHGRRVVSTSYDDNIRVWDVWPNQLVLNTPLKSFRPATRVSHNCQTGKWLTILKAQWSQNPDAYPHLTIGNMNHSLDILTYKGDVVARLSDSQRITAVQAVTVSHPSSMRIASGNASGRCVLWAPPGDNA